MTRAEFIFNLPEITKGYRPATRVIEKLKNIDLLMVVGPSGVGKTSVINKLGIPIIPPDTTRDPRPEETNGRDFNFRQDFDQIVQEIQTGQFVQLVVGASGDLYATKADSYPDLGRAVLPVMANVLGIFRTLGFKSTQTVFITPPSHQEWFRRLSTHNLNQDQLDKRMKEARQSLHLSLLDNDMHFILNDDLDKAAAQIKSVLVGQIDLEREGAARSAALKISNALH